MNEVAKTNSNLPATGAPPVSSALQSDLIIPKVLLMQGLSELVNDRKAQQGDMVRSTTGEKLGDDKEPVEVIPLTLQNVWMLQENQNGDGRTWQFRGYEPRTPENEALPWEFNANGTAWKRTKIVNLFALLPRDIEAYSLEMKKFEETGELPDVDKVILPVMIPFRNTSFNAGRSVSTLFKKAEALAADIGREVPVFGKTIFLKCYQDKNDKGTYFVFEVDTAGKKTDANYLKSAGAWYNTLRSLGMNVRVDDADEPTVEAATGGGSTRF